MQKSLLSFLTGLALFAMSSTSFAWGGRGHHAICDAATHLVKSPQLKEFLLHRPHTMGHLCNIPDIYWKSLSSESRKLGDPGHYINVEKIGVSFKDLPADYKKIIELYTGKPNKQNEAQTLFSIPDELGSNWWRADQFYRLALQGAQSIKSADKPKGSKEEQDNSLAYNKAVYEMLVNMGLMGHFVGDNGQPFHSTADYDGYSAGHGGIHAYYEELLVSEFGADIVGQIVKKARSWKSQTFTQQKTVIDNMRILSEVTASEVKDVMKLDPITTPSNLRIEKGMSLRTPAKRRPPAEAFKKMEPLLVKQMARSSYLLAHFWDELYKAAGSPDVKAYKSYQYPFTPDFIKPDYL